MVNLIRDRLKAWEDSGYAGATRTTTELLTYWQDKVAKSGSFMRNLKPRRRSSFSPRLGRTSSRDLGASGRAQRRAEGRRIHVASLRYAWKMATGAGKTTVMGMLTAWSILNKVASRRDKRFSDVVVVVCPNVTIRDRLTELQTGARRRQHLRNTRLGASHIDAPTRPGAGAGHQLARL